MRDEIFYGYGAFYGLVTTLMTQVLGFGLWFLLHIALFTLGYAGLKAWNSNSSN